MKKVISTFVVSLSLTALTAIPFSALDTTTVVVLPGDMATSIADVISEPSSWFFYNDETDVIDNTLGSFVMGPDTPPAGMGSVEVSVVGTERRNLATYQFSGTPLADITTLAYSTYNPSTGNGGSDTRSGYLNFNVDFDGSDTWQRRLVFVPRDNGTVMQDTWQEWDAIAGGTALWRYSGATWPVTGEAGSVMKSWDTILSDYPGVRVRVTDSWLGVRVGEPYADGYTENIDMFKFATSSMSTVWDFEPTLMPSSPDECKKMGWMLFNSPTFKNQGDCVSYLNSNENAKGNK